jgi:hypothetical protein
MSAFPRDRLRPDDSALVLFCAAFGGAQDAAHLREAGLVNVECWDLDGDKLAAMLLKYPKPWMFFEGDAFKHIDETTKRQWDVVTCDQFTNHDADVLKRMPKLLKMARRLLVISCCARGAATMPDVFMAFRLASEAGWTTSVVYRSDFRDGVVWLVFEKAAA